MAHNDLDAVIESALENLAAQEPAGAEAASMPSARALPPDAARRSWTAALSQAYAALGAPPVAVRSSATAEDLPELVLCRPAGHLSQRRRRGGAAARR